MLELLGLIDILTDPKFDIADVRLEDGALKIGEKVLLDHVTVEDAAVLTAAVPHLQSVLVILLRRMEITP